MSDGLGIRAGLAALALLVPSLDSSVRASGAPQAWVAAHARASAASSGGAAIPGTLKEAASVDPNGALSFNIPIPTPPGILGMQPDLTLSYNSQQTNGVLGVGWSLTGLPTIERTKRIRATDGVNGTIAYDSNDRFAFQGRRLMVTAGSYGRDGSVYHTEIESWQLVTASGQAGAGPLSFTAQAKDGKTFQFGATPDSRAAAAGRSDIRVWAVNRIADLNGNAMTISYSDDPLKTGISDHQLYPMEVAYTVNGAQPANRFVRFAYAARPDVQRTFVGGSQVTQSVRLTDVKTYAGDALVSDFRLGYAAGNATGRSRLVSVTRFAGDPATAAAMAPATFTYSDNGLAFGGKQSWLANSFSKAQGWDGQSSPFTVADVSGDGFLDIVGFMNGTQVSTGGASGFRAPSRWIDDFSSQQGWTAGNSRLIADVSGDGIGDIVAISNAGVETALSSGSAFVKNPTLFPFFSSTQGWTAQMPVVLQDVNGDSIMDIVGVRNSTASVALGQGGGTFATPTTWVQGFGLTGDNYQAADFNGDGNADLLHVDSRRAAHVALSTGSSFDAAAWQSQGFTGYCQSVPVTGATPIMIAEANGDGLSDVIAFCDAVYVTLSNGRGFQPAEKWNTTFAGPAWSAGNLRLLTDLNGDGMADLVGVTTTGVIAALADGAKFADQRWDDSSLPWGTTGGGSTTITTRLLGDANADGLMDMVGIGDTNVYVGLVAGAVPDLMTAATRSAGARYAVTYAPLSDPTAYSETNPANSNQARAPAALSQAVLAQFQNFPPIATMGAMPDYRSASRLGGFYHVVKQLTATDNPAVGDTAFSYEHTLLYRNGKVDLNGRGWLGFGVVTTNSGSTRQEVKTYRQDFPFTGQVASTAVNDRSTPTCAGAPARYSNEINNYSSVQGAGPVFSVLKTDTTLQALQACTVAHAIRTNYGYDTYGNANMVAKLNLVDAEGKPLAPARNLYILTQYLNDPQRWILGYPQYRKLSASSKSSAIETFVEGVDLSLTAWTYDTAMNVRSKGTWDDGNDAYLTESYTRDSFGNLSTLTKPSGAVYLTPYDATYRTYPVSRTVSPAAGTDLKWTFAYDPRFGVQAVQTDPNGVTTHICYDGFGRISAVQAPYPDNRTAGIFDPVCVSTPLVGALPAKNVVSVQQIAYVSDAGLPAMSTSLLYAWPSSGERQTFLAKQYFDGLWRESKLVGYDPGKAPLVLNQLGYTAGGKLVASALPYEVGDQPQYATVLYDVLRRPTLSSTPFGLGGKATSSNSVAYLATATGMSTTNVAATGTSYSQVTNFEYAYAANQLTMTAMSMADSPGVTDYAYDLVARPQTIQSPAGQDGTRPTYSITYDSMGRQTERNQPTRGSTKLRYDSSGNLHRRQQAGGVFVSSYDAIGRRTGVADSDGRSRVYTYDAPQSFGVGLPATASVVDAGGTIESRYVYGYDANGNSTSTTLALASPKRTYQTLSAFDPQARPVLVTNPDGSQIEWTYGGARLAAMALGGEAGVTLDEYSPSGAPLQLTYENGVTERYVLNADGSPYQITVTAPGGALLLSRQYEWDQLHRLSSISDPATNPAKTLRTFGYQGLRLAYAADSGGSSWTYGYDDAGNLTAHDGSAYTYAGTKAGSATGGAHAFVAQYNAMGDMTALLPSTGDAFDYTYDARDQLTGAKRRGDTTGSSYLYNVRGRRLVAAMPDGSATVYVSPSYFDAIAAGLSSPTRVLTAFDRPFAQWGTKPGEQGQYYLHTDHQRSVVLTTGAGGQALSRFAYSPSGELQPGAGTLPRFLYTGQELDPYSGQYWLGYRSYHPGLARFNKPDDRLGATPDRQDAINDNAYALNNPATYFDSSGHASIWFSRACGSAGIALGVAGLASNNQTVTYVGIGDLVLCTLGGWAWDEYSLRRGPAAPAAAPAAVAPPAPPGPPAAPPGPPGPPDNDSDSDSDSDASAQDDDAADGSDDESQPDEESGSPEWSDEEGDEDLGVADDQALPGQIAAEDGAEVEAAGEPLAAAEAPIQEAPAQLSLLADSEPLAEVASNSAAINSVEAANLMVSSESAAAVSSSSLGATAAADAAATAGAVGGEAALDVSGETELLLGALLFF